MAVTPIWKDTEYTVSSGNSPYEYYIELETGSSAGDETIFHGKAWVRPGEQLIHININKIAQDYLTSDLPDLRAIQSNTTYQNAKALRKFYVKNSSGTTVATYDFILDWSYDDNTYTAARLMSYPINGHGCNGMFFLTTTFSYSSQMVTTAINFSPGSSYDNTHCGEYAIYYLARTGGWCSFLIEGNVTKSDKYTKYNISVPFNNTTLDFQKKTYHNEITTTYQMNTGWLTDEQAENLAENLLGSNKAYLHNLKTGEIMPVLSTEGTAIYKTFKNQGNKKVNYSITVECSQTKHNVS